MQKSTLITIICLLLLSHFPNVFADNENVSKEIERIEIGENVKIVYYKDGHKEMFVSGNVNVNFDVSGTAQAISSPPPEPFPIDKILGIIKHILEALSTYGVGGSLLAWKMWNVIKRLRRGRPRDYRGVTW